MSGRPETTSTYARLADLPLLIDGYALEGLSRRVSTGFRRFTTAADVASREYRRWAVESVALDLALRQSGLSLHGVFARRPEPVRFVVSLNLGPAEYDEPTPPADAQCPPMTVIPAPSGFRATPARRREAGRVLFSAHKQRIRHED